MPLNFRWTGLICAALPEARVVHVTRDPIAVSWSLYKHAFTGPGNAFAYDLADIASYIKLADDMMAHCNSIFPGRIHRLDYAALIDDPTASTRALAKACDLEWTDRCLSPHLGDAAVLTASSAQVRQPIYSGSDAAWRRYEPHLGPLRDALKLAGVSDKDATPCAELESVRC
jgi:hypothetical protein